MRPSFLLLLTLIPLFFTSPAFAQAGYIQQCGIPDDYDLPIYGDFSMCDYYSRQFLYKEQADKYNRQLKKRQELFAAPRNIAYRQYKANLDRLHYGEAGVMTVTGDAAPQKKKEETTTQ